MAQRVGTRVGAVLIAVAVAGCATGHAGGRAASREQCSGAVRAGAGVTAFAGRVASAVALIGSVWSPLQLVVEPGAWLIEAAGEALAGACVPASPAVTAIDDATAGGASADRLEP